MIGSTMNIRIREYSENDIVQMIEIWNEVVDSGIAFPQIIGRCGHISNASYAVKSSARGLNIGEKLVKHSLDKAKGLGFKIIQFNAVVKTNYNAIKIYEKLGFIKLGVIPNGFLMKDESFEDIIIFYRCLAGTGTD